jgi:epoxyqueuosine reductase QueG
MCKTNDAEENTNHLKAFFSRLLTEGSEKGDIGIASFRVVYDELMDVQKQKLREIVALDFDTLYESGSIISIGVSYHDPMIDYIDSKNECSTDYDRWNEYAREYDRINQVLNRMAKKIANQFDGIALKATIGGKIGEIGHVREYFPLVISHRSVAEHAGIGWRGKNQLIIHEQYSCAIRFASIITPIPLLQGKQISSKCGDCTACEDACGFIRHRDILPDFRENCRKYILFLQSKGIEKDICGKCIKACYRSSKFRDQFSL